MATYTATADANGNFNIPFTSNYNAGQKVTVVAEKDGATKSIELYAPSAAIGATMEISGSMVDYPLNVGDVTLHMTGKLQDRAFSGYSTAASYNNLLCKTATTINLVGCTEIGEYCFEYSNVVINNILETPTLTTIGRYAFAYVQRSQIVNIPTGKTWGSYVFRGALITEAIIANGFTIIPLGMFYQCTTLTKATIPATVTEFKDSVFSGCTGLVGLTILATTPPVIASNSLQSINSNCVIKVPSASLSAYQAATNWSAHASKMVGI